MKTSIFLSTLLATGMTLDCFAVELSYPIGGTGQTECYDNFRAIAAPQLGEAFYGQDAQHSGNAPSYRDNGDGTVSDLITGLTWVKARGEKMSWADAMAGAKACRVGGARRLAHADDQGVIFTDSIHRRMPCDRWSETIHQHELFRFRLW